MTTEDAENNLSERDSDLHLLHERELPERYVHGEVYDYEFEPDDWTEEDSALPPPIEENTQPTASEAKTPQEVLLKYWGYDSFRPMQLPIIESVLAGKDTLGLLPTGGGKSITFQVPGLLLPGLTLVVTPLIALMKDQVAGLRQKGIKVAAIHAGMSREKIITALDNCIYGRYKFLYVSPERLSTPLFLSRLDSLRVSLLVVDECHCISQWGYDFRPAYLAIADVRKALPEVPVLALTATATEPVIEDIQRILEFAEPNVLRKSFYRPNLSYSIRRTADKETMLLHILSKVQGSAIVYCRNRDKTRDLARYLQKNGLAADFYHAGLNHVTRELRQQSWMDNETRVIVCTNAFGMGIDKPDVRLVIHMEMPSSLEEYFQEAGRAGRDGELSYAVLLTGEDDLFNLKRRVGNEFPPREFIAKVYNRICNYLQVGEGEGFERAYDLDVDAFCRSFRMFPTQVLAAIRILDVAGIWEYREELTRSRLMMLVQRDELYRMRSEKALDSVLAAIMRSYDGLFADYVSVIESEIAEKTGLTTDLVYQQLLHLNKIGILNYIPQKNLPRIFFRTRREDADLLQIPRSAYEDRRERLKARIDQSLHYIEEENDCRSRMLLAYFGEQQSHNCKLCDVCLRRKDGKLLQHEVDDLLRFLAERLTEDSPYVLVADICEELEHHPDVILRALDFILKESWQYATDGDAVFLTHKLPGGLRL
ncbi:RecQ family ATP-dependent DNA helicase [Porphyromonas loveana]|uniref:ATP-dependent DNA helicase RecQ n=1 Tax=Porphyromonas loveana TaxID=1884669 RepID=A0A2U1F0L2_9PORP|nr:RecQ family ATP-dependent DNA helicase [Porphyromonas loveana]PVZ05733.1 ATP-dependent DNA helicase RecQ [Porphyromonas loveana]